MPDAHAERKLLECANIFCEEDTPLPPELQVHIDRLRQVRAHASPVAEEIRGKAKWARTANEVTARDRFARILLLRDRGTGGHDFVQLLQDAKIDNAYMPPLTERTAIDKRLAIPAAEADTAHGYVPIASDVQRAVPFTKSQEMVVNLTWPVNKWILFPFLTAQWKREQPHENAIPQAARDGATIVNYLRKFYMEARNDGREPGVVETSHVSVTFDGRLAVLWIHWYAANKKQWHMDHVLGICVDELEQNVRFRAILRNLQDWAVGERLNSIRRAIDHYTLSTQGSSAPVQAGRPAKKSRSTTALVPSPASNPQALEKRGRGRPRKSVAPPVPAAKVGRPGKTAEVATSASNSSGKRRSSRLCSEVEDA